jgi:murein DD-endopeptidase MepM/ murein hydrolase activator NlpD
VIGHKHRAGESVARLLVSVKAVADRWFPDRQILIRGPGNVVAVVLSQRRQVIASLAFAGGVLWLVSASCGMALGWQKAAVAVSSKAQLAAELAVARAQAAQLAASNAHMQADKTAAIAAAIAQRDAAIDQANRLAATAQAQAQVAKTAATTEETTLQDETQAEIDQVEGLLRSTGLDPATLAGAPPQPASGTQAQALRHNLAYLDQLGGALARVPLAAPVSEMQISSPFGYRADPFTGKREFHVGIDLRGPEGTAIYATAPGTVIFAGAATGYGRLIVIDHGKGLTTRYSHLETFDVQVGDTVALHQEIGRMGNSGWSTGPHLLYETRYDDKPFNPLQFLKVSFNDVQK